MKKFTLLLFVLPLVAFTSIHKYYVSLSDIKHNTKNKSVEIITNVFMDDIEEALNKDYGIDAQISNPNEVENINSYFEKYLKQNFKISINNEEKSYNFLGKEYDGDIVYFYLEINDVSEIKTVDVTNTILIKYFSEQQNLIKVKANGKIKSLILTKKNDKGLLKF